MTPEQYQKVMRVVDAVMDAPGAEMSARLALECAGDEELFRAAEQLLAENTVGFFEISPVTHIFRGSRENADTWLGQTLGAYRITEKIGAGGMGAVYLAERSDGEFRQKVAVKLIKNGLSSAAVLRKFKLERQILAELEHSFIARLIDGGTTSDDLPYLVMEYVEGVRLDEFLRRENPPLETRLDLFRQICAAVASAHHKEIVHRDLKPSNILVTKDGTPKLLDFGIAKILKPADSDETALTELQALTPEYAAPEQMRGDDLTVSSDIYTLGVILYQMLSGKNPHRLGGKKSVEIPRMILHRDPPPPSFALKQNPAKKLRTGTKITWRRDLDNIVLHAMRREPENRYLSVESFSADLKRYLDGLPVAARPATFAYRATSFIRRNRAAVKISATMFVIFAFLAGFLTIRAIRAENRLNEISEINQSLSNELAGTSKSTTQAKTEIARRAAARLETLDSTSPQDAKLRIEMADALINLGDLQGRPYQPNVGDTTGARQSYERVLSMIDGADANSASLPELLLRAKAHQRLGYLLCVRLIECAAGYQNIVHATELGESILQKNPQNLAARRDLGETLIYNSDLQVMYFGNLSANREDLPKRQGIETASLDALRRSLDLLNALAAAEPENIEDKLILAKVHQRLGFRMRGISAYTRNFDVRLLRESLAHFDQSLKISKDIAADVHSDLRDTRRVADQYLMLSFSLRDLGEYAAATENLEKSRELFQAVFAADQTNAEAQYDLVLVLKNLGIVRALANQTPAARTDLLKARQLARELVERYQNKEAAADLELIEIELTKLDGKSV
jgi:serine/threonine protein kinase